MEMNLTKQHMMYVWHIGRFNWGNTMLDERYITKIEINLTSWSDHYPTGCVLYHYDQVVDSAYCDSVEEYVDYFEENKENFLPHITEVVFVFSAYDFDDDFEFNAVTECAKEVRKYAHDFIYKKEK